MKFKSTHDVTIPLSLECQISADVTIETNDLGYPAALVENLEVLEVEIPRWMLETPDASLTEDAQFELDQNLGLHGRLEHEIAGKVMDDYYQKEAA